MNSISPESLLRNTLLSNLFGDLNFDGAIDNADLDILNSLADIGVFSGDLDISKINNLLGTTDLDASAITTLLDVSGDGTLAMDDFYLLQMIIQMVINQNNKRADEDAERQSDKKAEEKYLDEKDLQEKIEQKDNQVRKYEAELLIEKQKENQEALVPRDLPLN